jgi:ABC-type nitrate/sulfonate/bicarbonate transport system substrate-binding protein
VAIPFAAMVAALKAGRVDAMSAAQPFITGAEKAGAVSVLAQCQGPTAGLPLGGGLLAQPLRMSQMLFHPARS